jgi:hypothetical protein
VSRQRLTIARTPTGYWVVQRGSVQLTGAPTRDGAEAELRLLECLRDRCSRRRRPLDAGEHTRVTPILPYRRERA